jgi:hypothetical protein
MRDATDNTIYHIEGDSLTKFETENYDRYKYEGNSYIDMDFPTSLLSQEKGNYIFTQWREGGKFYTVYSKKDSKAIQINQALLFWNF